MTELTPADVLADLFESLDISPDVTAIALQRLTDAGFEVRSAWPVGPGNPAPAPLAEREEIARIIRKALVENWRDESGAQWDEDVLLTGCRNVGSRRGYRSPETAAQNLALDAADAILALSTVTPHERWQPLEVTEEMVDAALNAWFASPPSETDQGLERSMRAALEAAFPRADCGGGK